MNAGECAAYLLENDNFLILTHTRPDGDTIGCAAALVTALRSLGKTAYVMRNPEVTPKYAPFIEQFSAHDNYSPDVVVSVDVADRSMLQKNAVDYRVNIAIDHHPSVKDFADYELTDSKSASCGEVVLSVIDAMGADLNEKTATAIYVAVSTDTGCFSYDNTTGHALAAAARCADTGVDIAALNRKLFRRKTRARIEIEGYIYTNLEFHCGGRAAVLYLPGEVQRGIGADEDDLENIAAIPVSIDGVDVGITIRGLAEIGEYKVSVRSSPLVSSNEIARRFGGGGHEAAAGFTSGESPDLLKTQIVEFLTEILCK